MFQNTAPSGVVTKHGEERDWNATLLGYVTTKSYNYTPISSHVCLSRVAVRVP